MIVGSLQYLTLTGPDITHVVNLSRILMQIPNVEHFQGVKMILKYINDTLNFGLRLFHNHHVGCMTTQILIGEVVEKLGDQLQVLVST